MNRTLVLLIFIILLLAILFLVSQQQQQRQQAPLSSEFFTSPSFPTIDVVITWVNGNHTKFMEEVKSFGQEYGYDRYYHNDEIKYCLRSIETNMTFVRKIFLVVRNDQLPEFLDTTHYQIEIIPHEKIIPAKYLPTFNSITIENFLHKIPGLSEYFIYLNDDMIVLKPMSPDDFFATRASETKPVQSKDVTKIHQADPKNQKYWTKKNHMITPASEAVFTSNKFSLQNVIDQNNEMMDLTFMREKRYRSQHVPYACRISYLDHLDEFLRTIQFKELSMYEHSATHKFRDLRNVARYSFLKKYWDMYMYDCQEKEYSLYSIIINDKDDRTEAIRNIPVAKENFLVIHNEVTTINDIAKQNFDTFREVMDTVFPNMSTFEIKLE